MDNKSAFDPIILMKILTDINSNESKLIEYCTRDNSRIKIDIVLKTTYRKRKKAFKRLPIIKENREIRRYIWLSADIGRGLKTMYVQKLDNTKVVVSKNNNLLLSTSKYWTTYTITNTMKFVDLTSCSVDGISLHYKFGKIIKSNGVRACLGYFKTNKTDTEGNKLVVGVGVLSIVNSKKGTLFQLNNNSYIIRDQIVYRISTNELSQIAKQEL